MSSEVEIERKIKRRRFSQIGTSKAIKKDWECQRSVRNGSPKLTSSSGLKPTAFSLNDSPKAQSCDNNSTQCEELEGQRSARSNSPKLTSSPDLQPTAFSLNDSSKALSSSCFSIFDENQSSLSELKYFNDLYRKMSCPNEDANSSGNSGYSNQEKLIDVYYNRCGTYINKSLRAATKKVAPDRNYKLELGLYLKDIYHHCQWDLDFQPQNSSTFGNPHPRMIREKSSSPKTPRSWCESTSSSATTPEFDETTYPLTLITDPRDIFEVTEETPIWNEEVINIDDEASNSVPINASDVDKMYEKNINNLSVSNPGELCLREAAAKFVKASSEIPSSSSFNEKVKPRYLWSPSLEDYRSSTLYKSIHASESPIFPIPSPIFPLYSPTPTLCVNCVVSRKPSQNIINYRHSRSNCLQLMSLEEINENSTSPRNFSTPFPHGQVARILNNLRNNCHRNNFHLSFQANSEHCHSSQQVSSSATKDSPVIFRGRKITTISELISTMVSP